jgi:hypothetical protein
MMHPPQPAPAAVATAPPAGMTKEGADPVTEAAVLLVMDVQRGIVERFADACLDADPEVHQVLTGKVFPRQAEVRTVAEWAMYL